MTDINTLDLGAASANHFRQRYRFQLAFTLFPVLVFISMARALDNIWYARRVAAENPGRQFLNRQQAEEKCVCEFRCLGIPCATGVRHTNPSGIGQRIIS